MSDEAAPIGVPRFEKDAALALDAGDREGQRTKFLCWTCALT